MSMTSNPSRSFTSLVSVALAVAVAAGAGSVPLSAQAAPVRGGSTTAKSTQILDLNSQGQESFTNGDYEAAAHAWGRILELLDENATNREERNTQLLIMVEASIRAYKQERAGRTDQALHAAVDILRRGVAVVDSYEEDFETAYAGREQISAEAQQRAAEIRTLLTRAEADLPAVEPTPTPPKTPVDEPVIKTTYFDPPSGVGLIVGGSLLITAGLGATSMIAVGATMNKQASRDHANASKMMPVDEAGQQAADDKGRTGTALLVTGSVLTGVFLAGGATMLGIGIKRRMRYLAASPMTGRGFVGVSLRGRF